MLLLEGRNRIGLQFLCASGSLKFPLCSALESDLSLAQVILSSARMMMNGVSGRKKNTQLTWALKIVSLSQLGCSKSAFVKITWCSDLMQDLFG